MILPKIIKLNFISSVRRLSKLIWTLSVAISLYSIAPAQEISAEISISDPASAIIEVKGKFIGERSKGQRNLSFINAHSGAAGLAARIRSIKVFDEKGGVVPHRQLQVGEYLADREIISWITTFEIRPPTRLASAAHVSWIGKETGLLSLVDLLPVAGVSLKADVYITLPKDWTSDKVEQNSGKLSNVSIDDTFVTISRKGILRSRDISGLLRLDIVGEWKFTDDMAAAAAKEIFLEDQDTFGRLSSERRTLTIWPFPLTAGTGNWEAETRGEDILILSGDMPFRDPSEQKLHEQLRHEIFHFWIPGDVALTGNFAWFYEGFAQYLSLRSAVRSKRIRFEDMLKTLSQAAINDRLTPPRPMTAADANIYSRGLMIAFLIDISELKRGKDDGAERIAVTIYGKYRKAVMAGKTVDANTAILAELRRQPNLMQIADRYISGAEIIDLNKALDGTGLELNDDTPSAVILIKAKTSGAERRILDKLGYNN